MRAGLLAAGLAPLIAAAPAQAAGEEGVWQGTIGTLPVRACLTRTDDGGWGTGAYYYANKLLPLRLVAADEGPELVEQQLDAERETARWAVARTASGAVAGTWKSKSRSLPIALHAVPWRKSDDGPCGSDAFLGPRIKPLVIRSAPAAKGAMRYAKLIYTAPAFPDYTMASFALAETMPGDPKINAALRLEPAAKDGPGDYLACARIALSQIGGDGNFSGTIEPDLMQGDFLSAHVSIGWDCGGAHPDEADYHLTFDRRTGAKLDLAQWFLPTALERTKEDEGRWIEPRPALKRLILRHFPFDAGADDCRSAIAEETIWTLSLARRGIGFYPGLPHVAAPCADTAVVPFAELGAMLGPAGKQGAARLSR